jgi:NAD(P)H-flavin reductase
MGGGQGCSSIKQSQQEVALQGACYIPFTLSEAENLNHDVMRFRFSLQSDQHVSGVPVGNHITLKYKDESGQNILRSYTPVSSGCGFIDIIVKIYQRTEKYPEGGSMTQHLASMMLGDTVLIKGPMGDFEYLGKGQMSISDAVINKNKIGLIAGGSGRAPLLQILRAIRSNVNDQTEIWLIFANRTEHDLFLREELDDYLAKEPNKFHVHYILSKPSIEWESKIDGNHGVGHVTTEMVHSHMPPPGDDTMILLCGRPAMIFSTCVPILERMGYDSSQYYAF